MGKKEDGIEEESNRAGQGKLIIAWREIPKKIEIHENKNRKIFFTFYFLDVSTDSEACACTYRMLTCACRKKNANTYRSNKC